MRRGRGDFALGIRTGRVRESRTAPIIAEDAANGRSELELDAPIETPLESVGQKWLRATPEGKSAM